MRLTQKVLGSRLCNALLLSLAGFLCSVAVAAQAQTAQAPASLNGTLDQLQQTAQATNVALGHLRIEKWKADGDTRSAAQSRVESLERNLTSALPGLLQEARQKPADVGVAFRLYRNLNALYDVLNSVSEATETFGARQDADAITAQTTALQNEQRTVADYVERLATDTQTQLARYRTQAQAAPVGTPKKIVVDDPSTSKKTRKKAGAKATATPE